MKKIYSSKLIVASIITFISMNIFGGVYANEDISEVDTGEMIEVLANQERTKVIPTELERIFIEGTSIAGEIHTINVDTRSSQKLLYRFYEKNLSANKWVLIQDYSEKNSADWVPKGKGDYIYRVDIKELGSKKDSDFSESATIRINPSIPAELHSLNITGTNEAKTPQTIVANASGVNGVLYKFYVQAGSQGKWVVLQDYSEKNTITWTPEQVGSYNIAVHVKDKKSFEVREASMSKGIDISPLKPAVLESLELKGNLYENNNHTLIANATSTNGVLYRFYIQDEKTGKLTILQDFSDKNTVTWKPNKNGKYSYNVVVRDKRSESNIDARLSYNVTINPPIYYKTTEYKDTFEEALGKQNGVKSQNGKWVKASKDEVAEYLKPDRFLQFNPSGKDGHILSIEIKVDTLNVRSGASTASNIIATVSKGKTYVVLAEKNGWYQINAGGKIGWVSGDHVQYVNDVPREMYQFMVLSGQVGVTVSQLNNELKGKGILEGHGAAFIAGSKRYNVNELYLMAHSFLETGNGTSKLATGILVDTVDGKPVPPRVVYNMYGIGAFDRDPLKFGSERAYTEGWFTPELAITEGAHWISTSYINNPTYKQDTLYKMRFNPGNPGTHQYATDIAWAYKQISQIERIMEYTKRMDGIVLKFDIPKYR